MLPAAVRVRARQHAGKLKHVTALSGFLLRMVAQQPVCVCVWGGGVVCYVLHYLIIQH